MSVRPLAYRATLAAIAAAALLSDLAPARADGRFEAHYTISMAGISIGEATWTAEIGASQYSAAARGRASGVLAALIRGEGNVAVRGAVKDGRLVPSSFTSDLTQDDERAKFRMSLEDGNVTAIEAETEPVLQDRVPVTEAHKHGVIDPISALLVPVGGTGDVISREACPRVLRIFDGRRRYDLGLSFKRIDKVKADRGYAGPVAVCAMTLRAIAGHRIGSLLVKYLAEGREIELWLAPIPGTRVLAPFRLSVASLVGNMVVQADAFVAVPAQRAGLMAPR
ncbi:MAG: hypothetical protein JWN71_3755 [Xanthobacteraceae bacterium]|jgi:hypothetical protein|nr:hypothetical protein [Xanthobacteraceae bacterium]